MNDNNAILGPSSSPDTSELTKALSKAQAEYPVVAYDSANPHFKSRFASYAQCCDSLRGPLTKNGLSLPDFRPGFINGQWMVVGTLRHASGQWISGIAPLLMGKNDMQSFGAAMTYAKRVLLMALSGGFSGEPDTDGEPERPQGLAANQLQYQQQALSAVSEAKSAKDAQKVLDTVKLRVKEKAVPPAVYHRVQEEFDKRFKEQGNVQS
jgi:hypothetical protein